jgi:hypothetical protein
MVKDSRTGKTFVTPVQFDPLTQTPILPQGQTIQSQLSQEEAKKYLMNQLAPVIKSINPNFTQTQTGTDPAMTMKTIKERIVALKQGKATDAQIADIMNDPSVLQTIGASPEQIKQALDESGINPNRSFSSSLEGLPEGPGIGIRGVEVPLKLGFKGVQVDWGSKESKDVSFLKGEIKKVKDALKDLSVVRKNPKLVFVSSKELRSALGVKIPRPSGPRVGEKLMDKSFDEAELTLRTKLDDLKKRLDFSEGK